jgi:hypothetical protein
MGTAALAVTASVLLWYAACVLCFAAAESLLYGWLQLVWD